MSNWTYIRGVIHVSPMGRTQAEMTYVLQTVLDHLPIIQGSEGRLELFINLPDGHNISCGCDEFDQCTNNLTDDYGYKTRKGWKRMQDNYILTLNASLRDRDFDETFRLFQKWMCRLAKRVLIYDVLLSVNDSYKKTIISDYAPYCDMWEKPSCGKPEKEPNWCEYLMWKNFNNTPLPIELIYKYFNDENADKEVQRRWV